MIKYHIDGVLDRERRDDHRRASTPVLLAADPAAAGSRASTRPTLTVHLPVPARGRRPVRDRQRRRRPAATPRAAAPPTSPSTTGPIADADAARRSPPASTWRPRRAGNALPWTGRWDRVLGTHLPLLVFVLLARGSAPRVFGWHRSAPGRGRSRRASRCSTRRRTGIGPAQAKYIYSETVDRETYVATLMHAAEKGAIDLTRDGTTPGRSPTRHGPAGWAGLDPVTTDIAHILGGPGSSFTASKKDVAAGLAAQGRDRAVRQQRRDLGQDLRATWSAAGSAASAACWCWPASA